jgi:D-glycero-alpha-D-manno-heptose-7-phosphate kinase
VRAPVRISFGGGGTDLAAYYNRFGGFVVSAAIARYAYVAVGPSEDGCTRIVSADYGVEERFARGEVPPVEEPLALPKGALAWFAARGEGVCLRDGVDLFLRADVPPGTGLGSSSAMAVALFGALAARVGMPADAARLAELASWLEIERLDRPIGKQDQYASAFGGLNAIEFTPDGVRVRRLALPAATVAALDARLLLFSTGRRRDSAAILRGQRADTGAKPATIEGLHRIKALAGEMRDALAGGELDEFGRLLDRGWQEKRRLSSAISSAAIDGWYDAARAAGALGGKITGAGGGGFLLLYCPLPAQEAVRAAMAKRGLRELPFTFDLDGVRALTPGEADRFGGTEGTRGW